MRSSLVLLISLLSLSFFFYSCGETEDEVSPTIASTEVYIPTGTLDDDWIPLSNTYVTELLKFEVPPVSQWGEDPELLQKYKHALLLKEYGDIPQVRTILEFELNIKPQVTFASTNSVEYITHLDRTIAYLEALMFISPSEDTRAALESTKNEKLLLTSDMEKLREEDPELFVALQRNMLIEAFGNIPEVDTYTRLLLKILRKEPFTAAERKLFEEAMATLFPDEKEE